MKTKLEMAHEYLLRFSGATVADAWAYADAMQAEVDKREHKHMFLNNEPCICGVTMNDVANKPSDINDWHEIRGEEWQPDWSQAPDTATHWTMRTDGKCLWWKGKPLFDGSCFYDAVGICHTVGYAPSFGYTGDWRNSLRKRPQ